MKKIYVLLLLASAFLFQFCATKKAAAPMAVKPVAHITYVANIQGIITTNCSPCHIPPAGTKEPLNTYLTAKNNIDESIRRIQLAPTDRGFMPYKHPKMADSLITAFVKWKSDGLLEK